MIIAINQSSSKEVFLQLIANYSFLKIKPILIFHVKAFDKEFSVKTVHRRVTIFPLMPWFDMLVGQYRDDDHQVDAPHFMFRQNQFDCSKVYFEYWWTDF